MNIDITQTNNTSLTQDKPSNNAKESTTQPRAITNEDFEIIFKLIDEYKFKDIIEEKQIEIPNNDEDLTTRSFRSYKSVFESFSKYCKDNNLNQKDAIAEALLTYISK